VKSGQTRANKIRETKRAEVIKALKARGLIQKVVDTADELANLKKPLEPAEAQRLKAATDIRLALIKKYLPDIKQTELVGEEGADIKTVTRVERVIVNATDTDS
jgi:hypothetical protein